MQLIFFVLVGFGCCALPCFAVASPTYPDLLVVNATADANSAPGFPLLISVTLLNNGTRDSGIITVEAWLSADQNLTTDDSLLFAYQYPPLLRGAKSRIELIDVIPTSMVPGSYYLFIVCKGKGGLDSNPDSPYLFSDIVIIHDWEIPDVDEFCTEVSAHIFLLTNKERKSRDLVELEWDEGLYTLANNHAHEMAQYRYMDHVNRTGFDATARAKALGLVTVKEVMVDGYLGVRDGIAENLAFTGTGHVVGSGFVNPALPDAVATALVEGWMKSPGHRQNILEPAVTHLGVAVQKGGKYYYAAQNFW
jgi:uncharacterized protein YkwD